MAKPLLSKYSTHDAYLVSTAVFSLPFFFFFMKHGYKRVRVSLYMSSDNSSGTVSQQQKQQQRENGQTYVLSSPTPLVTQP